MYGLGIKKNSEKIAGKHWLLSEISAFFHILPNRHSLQSIISIFLHFVYRLFLFYFPISDLILHLNTVSLNIYTY